MEMRDSSLESKRAEGDSQTTCSTTCKLGTVTVIGVLLSLYGSIFIVYWPSIFDTLLNQELALTGNSKSFPLWEETPIPLYINFYFFNWTNAADFKSKRSKPILQELGPYVFREQRRKVVMGLNDKNHTITYQQNRTWIYEPSLSKGSLDDVVTTLNIPAVSAAFALRNENFFIKRLLNIAMSALGTKLVVHKKVREFLFEGYDDPLMDLGSILPDGFVTATIPFEKFGWFLERNGSAAFDGIFNMFTGEDDISKFGKLDNWNYEKSSRYYPSHCGYLNGSAGEFFPPKRDKTSISLFSSDICRTVTLNYKEEVKAFGVSAYRYWGDETMFTNKTTIPDNWCYCVSGECAPNGAVDVSTCKWGAPAYVSLPHFYLADPWYRESVIGMKPDEDKHQMFIDLEPRTGIPLRVTAALQINILLQPWEEFSLLRNVPKIYFPTLWFTQTAQISDELLPQVKILAILPFAGTIASLVIFSVGITFILFVGFYYIPTKWRKGTNSKNLKTIFRGESDSKTKKSLLSTFGTRLLSSTGFRRIKMHPESLVSIQNGVRIVHYAVPNNLEVNSMDHSGVQLSQGLSPEKENEELSPLRDDPYH